MSGEPTLGLSPKTPLAFYRWRLKQRAADEILAAIGIAVGVALVFGVLVANGSVTGSAGDLVSGLVGSARLQVAARSEQGVNERITEAIAKQPGVQRAAAILREGITVLGPTGRTSGQLLGATPEVIALGGTETSSLRRNGVQLEPGLMLTGEMAAKAGARAGQEVTVLADGSAQRERVSRILSATDFGALASSRVAIAALPIAQRLANRPERITQVLVQPRAGADATVARELRTLAGDRLDVQPTTNEQRLLAQAFAPNQRSTSLFALISTMIGFLLAATAMLLTLPERLRLSAELRLHGYSRAQIAAIIASQALLLGLAGATVGIALGYTLAKTLLHEVPNYLTFAFPISGAQRITAGDVLAAFGCGLLAAFAASTPLIFDLRRDTSLDSLIREQTETGQAISPKLAVLLAVIAATLVALVALSTTITPSATLTGGLVLALASALLIPAGYRTLLAVLTPISHGTKGMLALAVAGLKATATRSIGVAAIAAAVVYGSVAIGGARGDLTRGLESTVAHFSSTADLWVASGTNVFDTDPFRADALTVAIERLPQIAAVRPYQGSLLDLSGHRMLVRAHTPALGAVVPADQLLGANVASVERQMRQGGSVVVPEAFARERRVHVGERFALPTPSGVLRLRIAALSTNIGWPPGSISISTLDYQRGWRTNEPTALEVELKPGADSRSALRAVGALLATSAPGLVVHSAAVHTSAADSAMREGLSTLGQIVVLVLLSGGLAISASLCASLGPRRQWLATMKAEGYGDGQLWRVLLFESSLLVAVGCLIGASVGIYGHLLADRYLRLSTGFPAPFALGAGQIMFTLLPVAGLALLVIAPFGRHAARVPPIVAFQE
jgi:putative ABC transport system permease protein